MINNDNFGNKFLTHILIYGIASTLAGMAEMSPYYDGLTWTSCSLKSPVIRLFALELKRTHIEETSKSALLTLCERNSSVTSEFSAHRVLHADKASIWWRHHVGDSIDRKDHGLYIDYISIQYFNVIPLSNPGRSYGLCYRRWGFVRRQLHHAIMQNILSWFNAIQL